MRCLFKNHLLVNWNIENMYSPEGNDLLFLQNPKSEKINKQLGPRTAKLALLLVKIMKYEIV